MYGIVYITVNKINGKNISDNINAKLKTTVILDQEKQ